MKRILIVYHSGVGNTKMVAEQIYENLKDNFKPEIYSVEKLPKQLKISSYDGMVIGFPVIHTHPTERILEFVDKINKLSKVMPTYIFATCGLYAANTLRIFSKHCIRKNIVPVTHRVYRCAASDGVLLAPFMEMWFSHEKGLKNKVSLDCKDFALKLENNDCKLNMPRFKFYSILNYPNKLIGQHMIFPIYLHKNKCVKCNKCMSNCPAKALEIDISGYPVFVRNKCEKCYRCIHHCPEKALSLSKKTAPKKVLG